MPLQPNLTSNTYQSPRGQCVSVTVCLCLYVKRTVTGGATMKAVKDKPSTKSQKVLRRGFWCTGRSIMLLHFIPFLQCLIKVLVHVKHERLRGQGSHLHEILSPTKKHCSWNASWVAPPLNLWPLDVTLYHCVSYLHNWCLVNSLACKNWFSTAQRGWLRREWADQSEET